MIQYLLIFFVEGKPAVPSNALFHYCDKKLWHALADTTVITELALWEDEYRITARRSYRLDEITGSKLILQMDVRIK